MKNLTVPEQLLLILVNMSCSNCADKCIQPCSVVGVPSAEDWPQEVALPQSAFTPRPPKPIENLVPDMDEQGRTLLLVLSSKQIQIYDFFFFSFYIPDMDLLTGCGCSSLFSSNSLPSTPPGGYRPLLR